MSQFNPIPIILSTCTYQSGGEAIPHSALQIERHVQGYSFTINSNHYQVPGSLQVGLFMLPIHFGVYLVIITHVLHLCCTIRTNNINSSGIIPGTAAQ